MSGRVRRDSELHANIMNRLALETIPEKNQLNPVTTNPQIKVEQILKQNGDSHTN